jgi:tetratricopeptide (TPR) repeat protein
MFVVLTAPMIYAQCGPDPPTTFIIRGRVIAPGEKWDSYHEVLQLDESRLVGYGYTNSTGEFSLPEQPAGDYYVVVRIDGFKEYREKIRADGCDKIVTHFVYMEFDEEAIPPIILDFTGEVNEVVDVKELKLVFPRKAVDEYEHARAERLSGDAGHARVRLEKLVAQYPDFYDAHNALGSVYLEMKRFRDAEKQYNEARKLKPTSAAPLVSLGSLYVQEAESSLNPEPGVAIVPGTDLDLILDDARDVLREALKIKPDAAFAYYLTGIAEMRASHYDKSELNLKRALELEPKLRWSRLALGNLYMKEGKMKESLAQFDAYLEEYKKVSNRPEVQQTREKIAAQIAKDSK